MPEHEYLFVGGGAVLDLEREGHRVLPLPVLGTELGERRVRILATVAGAARFLPRLLPVIDRLAGIMEEYGPDLIVTDYEFFTQMAARRLRRPCVSLDNQHLLTHCRYERPPGQGLSRLMTLMCIRALFSGSSRYLITSFHPLPPKDGARTRVLPPVIRQDVRRHRPSEGEHGLVYLRGGLPPGLPEALKARGGPFVVYGLGDAPRDGNLLFKPYSEEEFLRDLASCRYVLCNGGHSTICEALFLGKPVLCAPVNFFYEQAVNAHLLSVAGYGEACPGGPEWGGALARFESRLEDYAARIREREFWGNPVVTRCLRGLIDGNRKERVAL
jgi:uncharacterized protein (TIGR00661 family)